MSSIRKINSSSAIGALLESVDSNAAAPVTQAVTVSSPNHRARREIRENVFPARKREIYETNPIPFSNSHAVPELMTVRSNCGDQRTPNRQPPCGCVDKG